MDITADILRELKCGTCQMYLSRAPVYLQTNGAAICGQCYTGENSVTRMKLYEATARLLRFPCKNQEFGCVETVPFAGEGEVIAHEEVCEHRPYDCWCSDDCNFKHINVTAMLAHCRDQHPDSVFENPWSSTHDIPTSSQHNYIITAFQLIFLLHTKVCVDKIYHSVRLLGTSAEASDYLFTLDIKRNKKRYSDEGQVAAEGCLTIQEATSLAVNTNTLRDVLGSFDGTTFTVTVKKRVNDAAEQLVRRMSHLVLVGVKCADCGTDVTVFRYEDHRGWRCQDCAPVSRACENRRLGCTHTDIDLKCTKHERNFCQERDKCLLCNESIRRGSLSAHYVSRCAAESHESRSTWMATLSREGRRFLMSSVAGTAVCWYWLTDNETARFELWVLTSLLSERLSEFVCTVRLTDPASGFERTFTPNLEYDKMRDWCVLVKKDDFPSWSGNFNVQVNISRL